jgi:lysine 2,3-aminomutase
MADIIAPETTLGSLGVARVAAPQPYRYRRQELVEPDWRRLPGWRDVTEEDWRRAQWQRAHCVKTPAQLRAVLGDLVDESFYADLERDRAERATMSMLLPPQMLNTMVPAVDGPMPAAGRSSPRRSWPTRCAATCCRCSRTGTRPGRATRSPAGTRCTSTTCGSPRDSRTGTRRRCWPSSSHLPAVLRALHADGPRRHVDAGRSPSSSSGRSPWTATPGMIDYLRRTPEVRDVVVSGGDVANLPWRHVEDFVTRLLEIENIRDIRLATKALMGLPQHWLQPDVGRGRRAGSPALARERGVALAIHTHVNAAQSVTPLVAEAAKAMLAAGVRDVRNQGVLMRGVNDSAPALLDLCFALADEASITPYYFYMCDMIPSSEHWRVSLARAQELQHDVMGYLPGFATPRIVCDVPFVGKRWVHQAQSYDRLRGVSGWTKNYRTTPGDGGRGGAEPQLPVLRPDRHAARRGPGVVGRARHPRGAPRLTSEG